MADTVASDHRAYLRSRVEKARNDLLDFIRSVDSGRHDAWIRTGDKNARALAVVFVTRLLDARQELVAADLHGIEGDEK